MGRRIADIRYKVLTVTAPAAGADWTLPPTGSLFRMVYHLRAVLTTDANVANRRVHVLADDQTSTHFEVVSDVDHAASLARTYTAHNGAEASGAAQDGVIRLSWPEHGLVLPPGHRLRAVTTNLQAGDQWSAIVAHVLEAETGWVAPAQLIPDVYVEEYDPTFIP